MNLSQHQHPCVILPALACLAVTASLVAGCSSSPGTASPTGIGTASVTSPDPAVTPSSPPTQTPTPTPTYTPASAEGPAENVPLPVMPEAAKVESKEGLEAFARYWYELANYTYEVGETSALSAVSAKDSAGFMYFEGFVERNYGPTTWVAGGRIELASLEVNLFTPEEGKYQVTAQIAQAPIYTYSRSQGQGKVVPQDNYSLQIFEAKFDQGHWSAINVATMATEPES